MDLLKQIQLTANLALKFGSTKAKFFQRKAIRKGAINNVNAKRVKRRKQFRGSMAGKALRGNKITNGEYGLVALDPCWIRSNQIEAARVAMTRYIKRGGKVWIKIFPDKPVTAKPAETRMGSGKGLWNTG